MKIHTASKIFLLITILSFLVFKSNAETIHHGEVYKIIFKSAKTYSNPYKDIPSSSGGDLLKVTFEGYKGEALNKEITIVGFWNGGSEWCVNFAPPYAGEWKYISFSPEKSMNGKKGNLEVVTWTKDEQNANPTRHGFVRVNKTGEQAGHFFEYSDGQPFLWIGDTWWNWTDSRIHLETFKQMVDNRSEKGFNIGQLFVPGNGWGRESSLLDETYTKLDTEHAKKVEEMIRYANLKGITVWIHGWWSRPDLNKTVGAEKMQRWWRYLVHRFGAYNVIWVLAGEYNMNNYGGMGLNFWKDLGKLIKKEDPYERIVSVHNTPPFWSGGAAAPQWATGKVLHQEAWLDYNQSQVGHGKYANEMIPQVVSEEYHLNPSKPIVVTECWYEFTEGNPTAMDIRFAAWSAILSGAAGHTYGGGHVWLASVPEAPGGAGAWPYEKGFARTTYDYEGAESMKHLAEFFKKVKWWNMAPHPELVQEYPQPFCLAKPGEEYVLYLRYAGTVKVRMDGSAASGYYKYYWFNPASGQIYDSKTIQGNSVLQFECPESYPAVPEYKDWVLYIGRK
ncbi:hypothetical protein AQPE_2755 [Aquipluma nitroreducens]|uniref:DUF4038 domain-containing protein n=1 Tax=Aquipluma nitroreducens TaxID=2010828 RepID=A0A5K7SAK1_9BACT|nr:DUF4038 domain-containing protein [Aquipluma nitroreducens]BBE18592.1 hypothetical protein AQPE_2755 [Aquipluma nitroreducens]